jgi:hypothetical protein
MSRRPARWGAALALALLSPAIANADDKEVAIERTFRAGQIERAKVVIRFTVSGMDGEIEETVRSTVKEVKKNGDVVTVNLLEKGRLSVAGQEQEMPEGAPATEIRTKAGRLVELQAEDAPQSPLSPAVSKLMANIGVALLPEKPVKPGSAWTTEFDNPAAPNKKATVKGELLGREKIGDVDCWKIRQTGEFEVGEGQPKMTLDMVYWLNPADGHPVQAEGSCKDVPTRYGPMNWTQKMTRLKPPAEKQPGTDPKPAAP